MRGVRGAGCLQRSERLTRRTLKLVMAGLDPAIHDFLAGAAKDADARDKPGHDERKSGARELTDLSPSKTRPPCRASGTPGPPRRPLPSRLPRGRPWLRPARS